MSKKTIALSLFLALTPAAHAAPGEEVTLIYDATVDSQSSQDAEALIGAKPPWIYHGEQTS